MTAEKKKDTKFIPVKKQKQILDSLPLTVKTKNFSF